MKLLSKYFICSRQSRVRAIQLLISLSSSYFSSHLTCASHRFGNHLSSQWRMKIPRMCLLGNLMIISKILSNYIKPLIILIFIKKKWFHVLRVIENWKKKTQKEIGKHSRWVTLQVFCIITSHSAKQSIWEICEDFGPKFYISGKFNFSLVGGKLLHTSLTIMQSINI